MYVATNTHVIVFSQTLGKTISSVDLAARGFRGITTLRADRSHLYLTAYEMKTNSVQLLRLALKDMLLLTSMAKGPASASGSGSGSGSGPGPALGPVVRETKVDAPG